MSELGEHKGSGIRYAMHLSAPKGGSAQMLRDPDGGWVSWEDYARLKAEVERLRKAGDTMAQWFTHNDCRDCRRDCQGWLPNAWYAAKDGKPSA